MDGSQQPESGPLLLSGGRVRCPKCGHVGDDTSFTHLDVVSQLAAWLVRIRKCPQCTHLFAALPVPWPEIERALGLI